jgi:hypothetical protein
LQRRKLKNEFPREKRFMNPFASWTLNSAIIALSSLQDLSSISDPVFAASPQIEMCRLGRDNGDTNVDETTERKRQHVPIACAPRDGGGHADGSSECCIC